MPRSLLEVILDLAASARPLEVGGVLLGSSDESEQIAHDLIGPGPAAQATPVSFVPDYEYQQNRLDELFDASGRSLNYLGDWHSHPGGVCVPSSTDKRAMRAIQLAPDARCPDPVMLICGGDDDSTVRAYRLRGSRAVEIRVEID